LSFPIAAREGARFFFSSLRQYHKRREQPEGVHKGPKSTISHVWRKKNISFSGMEMPRQQLGREAPLFSFDLLFREGYSALQFGVFQGV